LNPFPQAVTEQDKPSNVFRLSHEEFASIGGLLPSRIHNDSAAPGRAPACSSIRAFFVRRPCFSARGAPVLSSLISPTTYHVDADQQAREQLGSTGCGRGFALPHARIGGLSRFFGLFARLARPIDFKAIYGEQVELVFLLSFC
jgi:hypothetical protein